MRIYCIKCGKKCNAQPHNLKKSKTTEETFMCHMCSVKYKHFTGKSDMTSQNIIKYFAYLRVIKDE